MKNYDQNTTTIPSTQSSSIPPTPQFATPNSNEVVTPYQIISGNIKQFTPSEIQSSQHIILSKGSLLRNPNEIAMGLRNLLLNPRYNEDEKHFINNALGKIQPYLNIGEFYIDHKTARLLIGDTNTTDVNSLYSTLLTDIGFPPSPISIAKDSIIEKGNGSFATHEVKVRDLNNMYDFMHSKTMNNLFQHPHMMHMKFHREMAKNHLLFHKDAMFDQTAEGYLLKEKLPLSKVLLDNAFFPYSRERMIHNFVDRHGTREPHLAKDVNMDMVKDNLRLYLEHATPSSRYYGR